MKKKILKTLAASVLSFGAIALAAGCSSSPNESEPDNGSSSPASISSVSSYTVRLYSEGEVFQSLKVTEGSSLSEYEIGTPTKEGYAFLNWSTSESENIAYDLTLSVTSSFNLYAFFEEIDDSVTGLDVYQTKDENVDYYLVVGWWSYTDTSKLAKSTMQFFYYNLMQYLALRGASEEEISRVSVRAYNDSTVAELGSAVNADADVDILLGVGANITSTGNVATVNRGTYTNVYTNEDGELVEDSSRQCAQLTDAELSKDVFDYIRASGTVASWQRKLSAEDYIDVSFHVDSSLYHTAYVVNPSTVYEPSEPTKEDSDFSHWSLTEGGEAFDFSTVLTSATDLYAVFASDGLNVNQTKEEGVDYYLVVGWWSYSDTSKITKTMMKTFYSNLNSYLLAYGASEEEISRVSVRSYSANAIADLGSAINADGDVDIILGVGGNITTKGGVETVERSTYAMNIDGTDDSTRSVARLSESAVSCSVYNWILAEGTSLAWSSSLPSSDISVVSTIKIQYHVNGELYYAGYIASGAAIIAPTDPELEGYSFKYWSLTENGDEFDVSTILTADTDLYAVFEEGAYVVTWDDLTLTSSLVVVFYENYVNSSVISALEASFESFISTNSLGISVTWANSDTNYAFNESGVAKFVDQVIAYNTDHQIDCLLGGGSNILTKEGSTSGTKLSTLAANKEDAFSILGASSPSERKFTYFTAAENPGCYELFYRYLHTSEATSILAGTNE